MTASFARRARLAALAGLLAGTVVLGIGGRIAMRLVAYADPAPPRFTWLGALGVVGAGAAWGTITAPLLWAFGGLRDRWQWARGPSFGAVVLALATLTVGSVAGFGGRIVAPPAFIMVSAIVFPVLFIMHGVTVDLLVRRWSRANCRFPT